MKCIIELVKTLKRPVPQKMIIEKMKSQGMSIDSIKWALDILLERGFIRRSAYTEKLNTTEYVQIRTLERW